MRVCLTGCAWVLLVLTGAGLAADDASWRAEGENVLVVYAADSEDGDGNGRGDSCEAAEYYALRRGVPGENMLGLELVRKESRTPWSYRDVSELILNPVAEKLKSMTDDGTILSDRIAYILMCPGTPHAMDVEFGIPNKRKSIFERTRCRSVDEYLISVFANIEVGSEKESTSQAATGGNGPLGASQSDLLLPIFGIYDKPAGAKHFRQLRRQRPGEFDFYLVSRLGLDLKSARDMLDGAIYAERYLRLPSRHQRSDSSSAIWLDQKYGFAGDHVAAMAKLMLIVQGAPRTPFSWNGGLNRVWPLVIDNQREEIGRMAGGVQHKPTVTAEIRAVDRDGVTLALPGKAGLADDVSRVLYFPRQDEVVVLSGTRAGSTMPADGAGQVPSGRSARIVGFDVGRHWLGLDSTNGMSVGDTLKYVWPGSFPSRNCFFFYGFYGLGRYEDVFQFPPGSMGIHVDSSCMTWAKRAISRGIACTFGVTSEPLSTGIPYGDQVLLALSSGYDWAEANYGGLRLAQRWTGVLFGDPIYAPFRSKMLVDETPPVIGPVRVRAIADDTVIQASLTGRNEDELADVALFRLEYGPTKEYGQAVDYYDWPEAESSQWISERRFGYTRHCRYIVKGLERGRKYHCRLIARDPAGLESSTPDVTFVAKSAGRARPRSSRTRGSKTGPH